VDTAPNAVIVNSIYKLQRGWNAPILGLLYTYIMRSEWINETLTAAFKVPLCEVKGLYCRIMPERCCYGETMPDHMTATTAIKFAWIMHFGDVRSVDICTKYVTKSHHN